MNATAPRLFALKVEQAAFDRLLPKMLEQHRGQFVVVYGQESRGFFMTYDDAYDFALENFGLDAVFLLSEVIERDDSPVSIFWYAGMGLRRTGTIELKP
ncbi:MAG TPA: hypothetical protein VLX28_10320 [Thermoanaerobaculia bacterium]|nr:hypothetical protein [Thermoanaerobaculia bacterium]